MPEMPDVVTLTTISSDCVVCGTSFDPDPRPWITKIYCSSACNNKAYRRRRGGGDRHGLPPRPVEDRFWEKVEVGSEDECWPWQAVTHEKGYGLLHPNIRAHRLSYEIHYGAIPTGLQIDHLCNNPSCVNPRHLEVVTGSENMRRQWERRRGAQDS